MDGEAFGMLQQAVSAQFLTCATALAGLGTLQAGGTGMRRNLRRKRGICYVYRGFIGHCGHSST
jgi:hypothetical protein